jgi:predicted transcriptional regulator
MIMSKTLTFQVPDELYAALEKVAAKSHRPTELVALEWLARNAHADAPSSIADDRQAAIARFQRHMGAVDSGDAHSANNDIIDGDLADAYDSKKKPEA